MKKKVIFLVITLLFCLICFNLGKLFKADVLDNNIKENTSLKSIGSLNTISMMLETKAGSGEYTLENRNSWPSEGYVFNEELSKCENGSALSWDEENNVVVMSGSTSDKCYVYFDKYQAVTINSSSATASGYDIVIKINATAGESEISKYYYSKDNGETYINTTSNTYTFTDLETETYNIKYYVEDKNGKISEIITKQVTITIVTLASWVKQQYTGTQGENSLYYYDSSLENGAEDNSYRYSGANPNNFVCFGTNEESCPDDNLYRIIGVFNDHVKLIKWDYATGTLLGTKGSYSTNYADSNGLTEGTSKGTNAQSKIGAYWWNNDGTEYGTNTWTTSKLNKVNLNTNFVTNIGSEWAEKIETMTWKVGGTTYENICNSPAKVAYTNEFINPAETSTSSEKIGLMYTSDYGFAASPSAWTTNIGYYNSSSITDNNWMYMGLYEWTIVRQSENTNFAFIINYGGPLNNAYVVFSCAIRPVFYLKTDVKYSSGLGQKGNPVRLMS